MNPKLTDRFSLRLKRAIDQLDEKLGEREPRHNSSARLKSYLERLDVDSKATRIITEQV